MENKENNHDQAQAYRWCADPRRGADQFRSRPSRSGAANTAGGQRLGWTNVRDNQPEPSQDGVIAAVESLAPYGYTDLTGAYITFHSIIYVCPQHEQLVFETFNQVLPDECDLRT